MSKKISHSAYDKYSKCPKLYDYHYNHRLRPINISSNLVFGVAIDAALNALLLGTGEPVAVFQNKFKLEDMTNVEFELKDLQLDVFNEQQLEELSQQDTPYKVWACLRVKGRILLEAYKDYIYPMIKEVHSVQKELAGRPGVLDAVVTLDNHGLVLADHKTSGMPYSDRSIEASTQLALYSATEKIDQVAFIVLNKTFRFLKTCSKCGLDGSGSQHKTCAKTDLDVRCGGSFTKSVDRSALIQLIVGKVPVINKTLITEAIEETERAVANKCYPRDLTACGKMYGKPCPYIKKCWQNDDTGLEYVNETKEKK